MKTINFKAFAILIGLLLTNTYYLKAGVINNVQKFAGEQLTNFNLQGLLVIGGIIGVCLIIYIISNHLVKEKEEPITKQNSQIARYNHHRHGHTRSIVKKTS